MIVIATVFTIFLDFMSVDFSTEIFSDVAYWTETITVQSAIAIILFSSRSIAKDREKKICEDYIKLENSINGAYWTICEKRLNKRFENFIAADNHARRVKAYREKLNIKITRIQKKIAALNLRKRRTEVARRKFSGMRIKRFTRKIEKLDGKVAILKERLENAEEEADFVRIRAVHYTYGIIFRNAKERESEREDPYTHEWREFIRIIVSKVMLIVGFGLISTSYFVGGVETSLYAIYKMAIRLFQIVFGIYTGVTDGQNFIKAIMCSKLAIRLNYVQKFIEENAAPAKDPEPAAAAPEIRENADISG